MLFNSPEFALFFPVVTLLYFLLPGGLRWALLLGASFLFYMAFIPKYVLILVLLILLDYAAGLIIEKCQGQKRKIFLILSLIANCSMLGFFKYFHFLAANTNALNDFLGLNISIPYLNFILPIGLSFHTFQSMSYTLEVYWGRQKAETNLGIYALYVMFYPQLVAGPIERPQNLLHQFRTRFDFDSRRVVSGLSLMLWGLFKKMVIADRLALTVNQVFDQPGEHPGLSLWIASYFFAYQIYCDFSGYSDVAIGAARVMGFTLMKNFDRPYAATNLPEFWHRWHISLSTWFRDYVYIPLGGSRNGSLRRYANLMIVFAISGLWHGASWNFVVWGLMHGAIMIASLALAPGLGRITSRISSPFAQSAWKLLAWTLNFHIVVLLWVFFRARTLGEALSIIKGMAVLKLPNSFADLKLGIGLREFLLCLALVGFLELAQLRRERVPLDGFYSQPRWVRWAAYYSLILAIAYLGKFSMQQFIYFQF